MFHRKYSRKQFCITTAFFSLFIFVFIFVVTTKQLVTINQNTIQSGQHLTISEELKIELKCRDRELNFEKLQYGSYWLLQNVIAGEKSNKVGCVDTITYTTNGDYTFFGNLPLVLKSWLAPISFAIYAPGYDFENAMKSIQYVRNCLPEGKLIQDYVSFHIFFPNAHMPRRVPRNRYEALFWNYDCNDPVPYENVDRGKLYTNKTKLTYPINVARNIARKAVNTYFILASDIELIPSPNISRMFLDMVHRNLSVIRENKGLRVFPMPVFEVEENAEIPETKEKLKAMLSAKTAITFHKKICTSCHLVPNYTQWLNKNETDVLEITSIAHRKGKFVSWEPFYISDNKEPMFDERVTWEGQSNKRIQNYAMCLLGYQYLVLHPSFLVHTPGIKVMDLKSWRQKFVPQTNSLIKKTIKPEYIVLYGNDSKCKV